MNALPHTSTPPPSREEATPRPPSPRPRRRWRRPVGLVVLLLLVAIGILEWQGWPFLRGPLERQAAAKLQRRVSLTGDFQLHLLTGLRAHVGDLEIGQPRWLDGQADKPMLKVHDARVSLPYAILWQAASGEAPENWHIKSIEAGRVEGLFLRDKSGRANWSMSPDGLAKPTPTGSKPAAVPHMARLVLHEGDLSVQDALRLLDMHVTVSTTEGEAVKQGGGLRLKGDGHYQTHPFQMHVEANGVLPLLGPPAEAPPVPIAIRAEAGDAKLNFEGKTRDLLNLGDLEGQLSLEGASLASIGDKVGVTLPTTAPFSLKGQLRKNGDRWGMQVQDLKVGSSQLKGQFSFDRGVQPPFLQGELTGPRLALIDLAPALGAPVNGAPNPKPPSGHVLPQKEFDVPSLRAMNAEVRLHVERATLGRLFAQPLEPLMADIKLRNGVLDITNIVARTSGGNLGGGVKLESRDKTLHLNTDLKWAGIRLEQWLVKGKAVGANAKEQPTQSYVSGELAGQAQLQGQGRSTAQLLGSLEGQASLWVNDGRISKLAVQAISLHVAEALGLLISGDSPQPMQCAVARMRAHEGLLTPEVAVIDTPAATLMASGSVSLAKEELNMTVVSHPKSLSPLSLRTPVDIRGTFADPGWSLHSNPLGIKVAAAAALATLNPLAAIIPLIDVGKDHQGGCQQVLQGLQQTRERGR